MTTTETDQKLEAFSLGTDNEIKVVSYLMRNLEDILGLSSDHFLDKKNKAIFQGIVELNHKKLEFDIQTLATLTSKFLPEIQYTDIDRIYTGVQDFKNISFCKALLKENFIKYKVSLEIIKKIYNDTTAKSKLNLRTLRSFADDLSYNLNLIESGDNLITAELIPDMYKQIIQDRLSDSRIRTLGYHSLDQMILRPAAPGEITILGGDKGSGKSIMTQAIENNLIDKKVCVLKLSLEMKFESSIDRMLCLREGFRIEDLQFKNKVRDQRQISRIDKSLDAIGKLDNYIFSEESTINFNDLEAMIVKSKQHFKHKKRLPPDDYMVVFIDLLSMLIDFAEMTPTVIERCMNSLHRIAKRHGVHIFGVVQTSENKVRSNKQPTKPEELDYFKLGLEDIKNGSAYAERARVVMILNRPLNMKKKFFPEMSDMWKTALDPILLNICKQNEGDIGQISFSYSPTEGYKIVPLVTNSLAVQGFSGD
jgi:replicative DNA helicase